MILAAALALAADVQTWSMPGGASMRLPAMAAPAGTQVETISMLFWPPEQNFAANVNVQRQVVGGMEPFILITKAQFPLLGWVMNNEKRITVAGLPAWRFDYTGQFQMTTNHWDGLAVEAKNGDIWLVTCTTLASLWTKYQSLCGQALGTFVPPSN